MRSPRILSPSARRQWRAICRDATDDQRDNPAWLNLLTVFCEASDRADVAAATIRREGILSTGCRGARVSHPAVRDLVRANRDTLTAHRLLFGNRRKP
ncbi:hypothetical protein AB4Y43_18300 [Paraburkholderia sp. BR10872]|uniref:P27 family phage terminase small subunit n=1 Tax=Paraburkholderia sp. BR10872 TaxID=3236989 RepID=UPI0034D23DA9